MIGGEANACRTFPKGPKMVVSTGGRQLLRAAGFVAIDLQSSIALCWAGDADAL